MFAKCEASPVLSILPVSPHLIPTMRQVLFIITISQIKQPETWRDHRMGNPYS